MIVYLLRNRINGKGYVGITTQTLNARWSNHKTASRGKSKYAIACAIRKWGPDVWDREILQTCDTLEELKAAEVEWIARLGTHVSTGLGYNMSLGGEGSSGLKRSPETRARMSAAAKARGISPTTRAAVIAAHTGRKASPETRAKMSVKRKGIKRDPEILRRGWVTRRSKQTGE